MPENIPLVIWSETTSFQITKWTDLSNSILFFSSSFLMYYVLCLVVLSCLTLCDPMDCNPPDSSIHEDSPGQNTGVGCHALLGIFPIQGLNPGLPHCRQIHYHLSHKGSPVTLYTKAKICLNPSVWIVTCI